MSNSDIWHYPRPDLAEDYLAQFESGLNSNLVLFAPRRTGKTQFVQQDLLPLAREKGYITVTIDFWSNKANPIQAMFDGLHAAYERLDIKQQSKVSNFQKGSVTTSVTRIFESKAEVGPISFDTLAGAFNAFAILMEKTGNHVLMHLDEVQHLATDTSYESATATLRTFIDKNPTWLRTIMTGSSSDNLQRLFRRRKAPFYQSVDIVDFPKLGSAFVNHILGCYKELAGTSLPQKEGLAYFHMIHRNPEKFSGLVRAMVKAQSTSFEGVWSIIEKNFDSTPLILDIWESLSDIEAGVAVLVLMMENGDHTKGLYSEKSFEFIAKYAGFVDGKRASKSTIQNGIEKLRSEGWIFNAGHGQWKFEDPEVKAFLEANAV